MTQKIFSRIIFTAVAAVLILPQIIFAQMPEETDLDDNNYPKLSQWEAQKLLKDSLPKALSEEWQSSFVASDKDRFYMAVPLTLRSFVNHNFFHYLLNDVPLDAARIIVIQGIEIARIILADDYSSAFVAMLDKFEKDSVQAAINYAKSELFKYQIKLSTGAFEPQYRSEQGEEKALIQYVIIYKEKGNDQADVSIRIYSIEAINPPEKGASFGIMTGVIHSLQSDEQIPPFVVTFSGVVQKDQYGGIVYSWVGQPQVDISFPADVPDLGLRPKSWWERNIVDPIKDFFAGPMKSLSEIFGAQILPAATNSETDEFQQDEISSTSLENMLANGQTKLGFAPSAPNNDDARQEQNGARQNNDVATDARQQNGQIGVSATIGATNASGATEKDPGVSRIVELTPGERQQAITDIVQELLRRRQDEQNQPQTPEQEQDLRQALISIVQELAKRAGQSGKTEDSEDGDSEEDAQDSEQDDSDNTSGIKSATVYCEYQPGQMARSDQVVINEIAWMGTAASANHEWIELKNITSQTIYLADWQLQDKDQQIKIAFGTTSRIAAGQLFLLERTDDDAVPGIKADLTYKGALSNTSESLYLFGPDCQLQDKVEASPNWPAGSDSPKKTMERGNDLSWHTYSGSGQNNIFGTPGSANGPAAQQSSGGGGSASQQQGQNTTSSNSTSSQNTTSTQPIPPIIAEPAAVSHLIISEVQLGDGSAQEYVELYNPTDQDIVLCPDAAGASASYYFSYYSASRDWSDPYRNKSFCDSPAGANAVLQAKDYYLISFNGWPEAESDWPMYSSSVLSDSEGAIAVFSDNPKNATGTAEEMAVMISAIKADVLGWKRESGSSEPKVKEANAAVAPSSAGQVLGRLWHNASQKYQDTDDNAKDFASQNSSPKDSLSYAPEAITDLAVQNHAGQKNAVRLSWPAPNDPDTPPDQLEYKIFFIRNQEPKAEIETETTPIVTKQGEEVTAVIPDLYYNSDYYFLVQATDERGNISPLSNASSIFTIAAADHPWPMARHDTARTNKGEGLGPAGGQTTTAFAGLSGDFRSPPVIDENGTVYFFGRIENQSGIYAFDAAGKKKWFFTVSNSGQIPALSPDGTIYFFAPFGVGALSPAGHLKWSESFNTVYTNNPVVGPDGCLYLIVQNDIQVSPHLIVLTDEESQAIRSIDYDLAAELAPGETSFSVSGPVLDNLGNIYLTVNQKLIKLDNSGQKIGERTFVPEYASDYEGPQDKVVTAGDPYIFNEAVIIRAFNGYCLKATAPDQSKYDTCQEMVYSVNSADLNSENWKKPIPSYTWSEAMGNELYYSISRQGLYTGGFLDLYAISLSAGNSIWTKQWTEGYGMPAEIYPVLADNQGYAYFARGSAVLGYDLNQMLDSDPSHGLVFSGDASNPQCSHSGGALGPAGLYIPSLSQLNLISAL